MGYFRYPPEPHIVFKVLRSVVIYPDKPTAYEKISFDHILGRVFAEISLNRQDAPGRLQRPCGRGRSRSVSPAPDRIASRCPGAQHVTQRPG